MNRPRAALTPREVEVVTLYAHGLDSRQIADKLGLSQHTVRTHAANAEAGLKVHTMAAAVWRAEALGYLPPGAG